MIGVVEGLLYAHKAGLDLEETIAAVGAGAAGCVRPSFRPSILDRPNNKSISPPSSLSFTHPCAHIYTYIRKPAFPNPSRSRSYTYTSTRTY